MNSFNRSLWRKLLKTFESLMSTLYHHKKIKIRSASNALKLEKSVYVARNNNLQDVK